MNRKGISRLILPVRFIGSFFSFFAITLSGSISTLQSQETSAPLHEQIDHLLTPHDAALPHAEVAETLLLRRLYLDLVGVPPTLVDLQTYQSDSAPDKYSRKVKQLLQSPEFVEHWVKQLDLIFMERRANTHIAQLDWEEFLRKSLSTQQPFHKLCAEILSATGAAGPSRPAARFYLDRGGDPHLITRDVGRIFFGRDLQCAQCHDHPLIDSYFQSDFQGIAAFFSGGYMVEVTEGDKKIQVYAEKSLLESPYESVFLKGTTRRTLPRVPGTPEVIPPSVQPGADYDVAPADGVAAKPKYSRRDQLAQLATSGTTTSFNENWANRFWTLFYGRGVIHPVDLIHADADPLHPELLPLLGRHFAASGFQLRSFLSELVQTKLYRSGLSEPLDTTAATRAQEIVRAHDWKKILVQRQSHWEDAKSQLAALGEKRGNAQEQLLAIEQERTTLLAALDQARTALIGVHDAQAKATTELAAAEKTLGDEQMKQSKLQSAATATDEAKNLLSQDAEVAKAAEILQQKLTAIATSVTNLASVVEEKRKLLMAAQAAIKGPQDAWVIADKAVLDKNIIYHQADQAYSAARELEERTRMAVNSLKREVDYAKRVIALEESIQDLESKQAELTQWMAQKEKLSTDKTTYLGKLTALEPQIKQATRDRDQAQEIVQVQQQRMQDAESKHQLILTAQAALQKLPDHQVDPLRLALDELQRRLSDSEKNIVSLRQELQSQQATLSSVQTQLTQLAEAKTSEEQAMANIDAMFASVETKIQQSDTARTNAYEAYLRRVQELRQLRMERFEYSKLVALTPEQLAWSLLGTMGFTERQVAAKLAEMDKANPLTAEQQLDTQLVQQRREQAYLQARKELQGNVTIFVNLYGAGAGQPQGDFFATADQALFVNNGGTIFSWAASAGDNVTSKFIGASDVAAATNDLYLSLLGRLPSPEEAADVQQYLNQAPEQKAALAQEIVWGILTSAEFRFNH